MLYNNDIQLRTIDVMGKRYKFTGMSPIWRFIAPNDTRLWNTKGILIFNYPALEDDQKGDWIEIGTP